MDDVVRIESHGSDSARSLVAEVSGLYAAVFGLPPFNAGDDAIADQRDSFPKLTGRPGFRLVLARLAGTGRYVGFGYGFLLPVGSTWWRGVVEPLNAAFTAETGKRTFAVIDYGVLPDFRGRGIGRLVHDELLGGSGAERGTLAVRPTATETQAIYRRWGWRRVGHEVMDPPVPSPEFDILVLDELPARPVTR
jgi:ribosomal protein S18 acetylase RimI-like enzyme